MKHWHVGTGIGAGNEDGDDYNSFDNPRDAALHLLGNLNCMIEDREADDKYTDPDPANAAFDAAMFAEELEEATQAHGELTEALPYFNEDGTVNRTKRGLSARTGSILIELDDNKLNFEVGQYLTFWVHVCDRADDGCGPDGV